MTQYALKFDEKEITFEYSAPNTSVFLPNETEFRSNPADLIKNALLSPLGTDYFDQNAQLSGKKIAIAINDQTRPLPHAQILPALLDFLNEKGAENEFITFYIATGTHRKLTEEEISRVLPGNLAKKYRVHCHQCDDRENLSYLGTTQQGTPVHVNRDYYQSDVKIVVGSIEPHHFMGFSGGMKTAAIGLTGRETIQRNHSMLPDPNARMGLYSDNPMRMDVEEIGRMIGVQLALNVILDDNKRIIHAFWGDPQSVMQAGIPLSLQACQLGIPQDACHFDLVIASAGGFPKDINLYQSQKALTNSCLFSKNGGVIILAAGCRDGAGNDKFVQYMQGKTSWQQVLDDFPARPFEIGPHKAYQLAQQVKDHTIILISQMAPEEVRKYMLLPASDMEAALQLAAEFLPQHYRTAILPYATHSMPILPREGK
jgi:nickel-dependent lactate racemase